MLPGRIRHYYSVNEFQCPHSGWNFVVLTSIAIKIPYHCIADIHQLDPNFAVCTLVANAL